MRVQFEGSVPESHCYCIAVPMRATGVRICAGIQLDAALGVHEQRAISTKILKHYAFEVVHIASQVFFE